MTHALCHSPELRGIKLAGNGELQRLGALVVGMLVALDNGADVVERGLSRQVVDMSNPGELALDADRVGWRDTLGMIEGAGQ